VLGVEVHPVGKFESFRLAASANALSAARSWGCVVVVDTEVEPPEEELAFGDGVPLVQLATVRASKRATRGALKIRMKPRSKV